MASRQLEHSLNAPRYSGKPYGHEGPTAYGGLAAGPSDPQAAIVPANPTTTANLCPSTTRIHPFAPRVISRRAVSARRPPRRCRAMAAASAPISPATSLPSDPAPEATEQSAARLDDELCDATGLFLPRTKQRPASV